MSKRRSYAETVQGRRRAARNVVILVLVFVCYELLSGLFVSAYSVRSAAMSPTLQSGDRILALPLAYGPRTIFGKLPGFAKPKRGDLVVVEPNYARRLGFWETLGDSFVRFVTFQLVSPARGRDPILSAPTVQRVIAEPGDTVMMEDFVFKVKSADSDQYLTEFEHSSKRYDISHKEPPESWDQAFPGSGHMEPRLLGKDEYFVAGDSRSESSDSRLWGPSRLELFRAKVVLRYWPVGRFGSP